MSGIPFIYYIPKKFFLSAFYKSFSFTCKSERILMYCWGAKQPYFSIFLHSRQASSLAVRHGEINCISIKSYLRNMKKREMPMAFHNFFIVLKSKIRGHFNSSFHCNGVNVFRHVDSIVVSSRLPNSLK